MKYLTIFLITVMLLGCNSDEGTQQFSFGAAVEFIVLDNEGNDLLNPKTKGALAHDDIRLYYYLDGKYEEVYEPHLDSPRNFVIFKQNSNYRIGVSLNHSEKEKYPKILIKWNESRSDTIKCEIYRTSSLIQADKIWLNNKLIWDTNTIKTKPYFILEFEK